METVPLRSAQIQGQQKKKKKKKKNREEGGVERGGGWGGGAGTIIYNATLSAPEGFLHEDRKR